MQVFIDGTECTLPVYNIAPIRISCTTGARDFNYNEKPSLRVYIFGNMVATQGKIYRYVSRWSDDDTWGAALKPLTGESVQVPTGRHLLLDQNSPELNLVILDGGSLIINCSPENAAAPGITLTAKYIYVGEGSYMEVGTEDYPCLSIVFINLNGAKDDPVMPLFGNKVIAVSGGTLEMHGAPIMNTWTTLENTVTAGTFY